MIGDAFYGTEPRKRKAEAAKPDPYCAVCDHLIILKGESNTSQYWQCIENCRCLLQGCVPKDSKYGTSDD